MPEETKKYNTPFGQIELAPDDVIPAEGAPDPVVVQTPTPDPEPEAAPEPETQPVAVEPEAPVVIPEVSGELDYGHAENLIGLLEDSELLVLGDDDSFESTPDGIKTIFKKNNETQFNAGADSVRSSFTPEALALNKFLTDGGKLTDWVTTSTDTISYGDLDVTELENQKRVVSDRMTLSGYTSDEITDRMIDLEASGSLEKEAGSAKKFLTIKQKADGELAEKNQLAAEKEDANLRVREAAKFRTELEDTRDISGWALDEKTAKEWASFVMDRDESGQTAFTASYEDPAFKKQMAFYAFMAANKKDFEVKANTAVAQANKKKRTRLTTTAVGSNPSVLPDVSAVAEGGLSKLKSFW